MITVIENNVSLPITVIEDVESGNVTTIETQVSQITEVETNNIGVSAYELAVLNGFVGTQAQWLLTLKGEQGDAGPQGLKGDDGDAGPVGPQGLKGDTGNTGPQGIQGTQGPIGLTGPQGAQGPKGDTGDVGPQGPQGLQGVQGPIGNTGLQGPTGLTGPQGATGPQGPQGNDAVLTESAVRTITDPLYATSSHTHTGLLEAGDLAVRFDAIQPEQDCLWVGPSGQVVLITGS